jgi:hypothetical protein
MKERGKGDKDEPPAWRERARVGGGGLGKGEGKEPGQRGIPKPGVLPWNCRNPWQTLGKCHS